MRRPLIILISVVLPLVAGARSTSFDTLNFRPTTDQGLYLAVEGTDLLSPEEWVAGFVLDYARSSLTGIDLAGVRQPIVRDLIGGHLLGAYGILDWLEVGLNPNFALLEKFFDPVTAAGSSRVRMGETRASAKLRIFSKEEAPVGFVFVPYIDLPTGSGASFVGNNSFSGGGTFAVETKRIEERLSFAFNLGYLIRDRVSVLGTPFDDLLTFGLAANFLVLKRLELIAEFHGGSMISNLGVESGTPFEGGGGLRYFFDPDRRWQLTSAVQMGIGAGLGNPSVRGIVGVAYTPPRRVKGVEAQEAITEVYQVYELKEDTCPFDLPGNPVVSDPACQAVLEELRQKCPDKREFKIDRDDPRCLKLYLSQ